jgi:hypothetical protein
MSNWPSLRHANENKLACSDVDIAALYITGQLHWLRRG